MKIEENVPLAPLTTFKIGGPARFFVRVADTAELKEALAYAREHNLATLILGGGSNMLVDDAGFNGLVIKLELNGVEREGNTLIAGAGESWDGLVERAVKEGLWGIENLSGIPGTVGAAPVQNIGAYGMELKDTVAWVEVLDTQTGEVSKLAGAECGFGYRTSRFKKEPGRYVVLRAAFALSPMGTPNTSYKDMANSEGLPLSDIRQKVLGIRGGKFPDLAVEGTAGSFFLNPVVSEEAAKTLAERYPGMPQFPVEGGVKLSTAWLLDKVLNLHGSKVGGARLYEKQPLVIVAEAGTAAREVRELAKLIQEKAKKDLEIEFEPEVRIIL